MSDTGAARIEPVEVLRARLAQAVRSAFSGGTAAPARDRVTTARAIGTDGDTGDVGLFGPDSVVWRVHADVATLVGGLRALLLQTLHPLAMAGVADHSDYRVDPWGRLRRTGEFLATTIYGPRTDALAAIAAVRRVHDSVVGVAPDGRPYAANDPALLTWVHACEADSFLRAHLRYAGWLAPADQDRYVDEMAEVAERLGAEDPPRNRAQLAAYFGDGRELRATSQARDAVRFLLAPPMALAARPTYGLVAAGAVGLLPLRARIELRLPILPLADPLLVRPAARTLLVGLRWILSEPPAATAAKQRAEAHAAAGAASTPDRAAAAAG